MAVQPRRPCDQLAAASSSLTPSASAIAATRLELFHRPRPRRAQLHRRPRPPPRQSPHRLGRLQPQPLRASSAAKSTPPTVSSSIRIARSRRIDAANRSLTSGPPHRIADQPTVLVGVFQPGRQLLADLVVRDLDALSQCDRVQHFTPTDASLSLGHHFGPELLFRLLCET